MLNSSGRVACRPVHQMMPGMSLAAHLHGWPALTKHAAGSPPGWRPRPPPLRTPGVAGRDAAGFRAGV